MVFKFCLENFANLCFQYLWQRMVAPREQSNAEELIPIKEMKIRLPVISVNISLNVFQRPGQDLGWRRRWNKPVPSPRFNQSLKMKIKSHNCHFSHRHRVFLIWCFWSGNTRNELQQEKETRYQVSNSKHISVVGHMLRIIPVFFYY